MKKSTVFIALSLALNASFAAAFFLRPSTTAIGSNHGPATTREKFPDQPGTLTVAQLSALQSGNVDRMKAAGLPDNLARFLVADRAFSELEAVKRAEKQSRVANPRFWRSSKVENPPTAEQRATKEKAQNEFDAALEEAFPNYNLEDFSIPSNRSYLSEAAREKLKRIEKDYREITEMIFKNSRGFGIVLPSDFEKLKLLNVERERDLVAALSPSDFEQYQLRESNTAHVVRDRYGDAIESEADYRRIFALQQKFDDRFGGVDSSEPALRAEMEAAFIQTRAGIFSIIGHKNYEAFQRANDPNYRDLLTLTKRLALPESTADLVYAKRNDYAVQSQLVSSNLALTPDERTEQLKALATKATSDLRATLGSDDGKAYAERANWISLLKKGSSFSTDPKDAPLFSYPGNTVYPLSPKIPLH